MRANEKQQWKEDKTLVLFLLCRISYTMMTGYLDGRKVPSGVPFSLSFQYKQEMKRGI
jgi:hypothetical protein